MYFDEFDEAPEVYENDLQDLSDREAFEDMIAERDELFWNDDEFPEVEDRYIDSAFEARYELPEPDFDYL